MMFTCILLYYCIYIHIYIYWLVVYLPLWKIWKSVGVTIPKIWKIKAMFQTTNQYILYITYITQDNPSTSIQSGKYENTTNESGVIYSKRICPTIWIHLMYGHGISSSSAFNKLGFPKSQPITHSSASGGWSPKHRNWKDKLRSNCWYVKCGDVTKKQNSICTWTLIAATQKLLQLKMLNWCHCRFQRQSNSFELWTKTALAF